MLCVGYRREKLVDKRREEESLVEKQSRKKKGMRRIDVEIERNDQSGNLSHWQSVVQRNAKRLEANTIDVTTRKRMKTQSEML
jgi:hypothetical protein